MSAQRLFLIIATGAAVLFAFITPPFQVPDEVGHFWRAVTIADGHLIPRIDRQGGTAAVAQGLSTLVFIFWDSGRPIKEQFELARILPLEPQKRARVIFPAGYTPVAYAPQAIAAWITRPFHVQPLITFYLGRLCNAIAYVIIIFCAIRVSPLLRWLIAAAGLLPMAIYLAASWSPDAMTIAASFLFTAVLLRGPRDRRDALLIALSGVFVGLCKPAYFLIVLLAFVVAIGQRSWRVLILVATLAAVAVSLWNASRMPLNVRPQIRIDPRAQIECIRENPSHVAAAMISAIHFDYVRQAVGRLGLLNIWLPEPIVWIALVVLLVCAWSASAALPPRVRMMSVVVILLTIAGIALSSYLGWTPPCSRIIDGLQGRYLLPIVPLIFTIISAPWIRSERLTAFVLAGGMIIANLAALYAVAAKYYI